MQSIDSSCNLSIAVGSAYAWRRRRADRKNREHQADRNSRTVHTYSASAIAPVRSLSPLMHMRARIAQRHHAHPRSSQHWCTPLLSLLSAPTPARRSTLSKAASPSSSQAHPNSPALLTESTKLHLLLPLVLSHPVRIHTLMALEAQQVSLLVVAIHALNQLATI